MSNVVQVKYLRRGKVNTGIVIGISVMALLLMLALCAGSGGFYYYYRTTAAEEAKDRAIFAEAVDGAAETMDEYRRGEHSVQFTLTALSKDYEVFESMGSSAGVDLNEMADFERSIQDDVEMLAMRAFHEFLDFEMVKELHGIKFWIEKGFLHDAWLKDQEEFIDEVNERR